MSDIWENNGVEQTEESATPAEPTSPAESATPADSATPAEPATSAEPATPADPATPAEPTSRVAPDGSYRYVPPRAVQPTQPPYPGSYPPPQGGYYAPPTPPTPPQKSGKGWTTALAILCAVCLVLFGVGGAFAWMRSANLDDGTPSENAGTHTQTGNKGDADGDKTPSVNDNAPQMNIQGSGDNLQGSTPSLEVGDDVYYYSDGGLPTEEIVSRNYNCTVVLTMYSRTTNFYFGESNLVEAGAASGIVMTADGYVITNRHCVIDENTDTPFERVDVTTYDGTVYEAAEVIGADEATDLAVIKIDAKNLTPAQFGSSDELEVGARVVALGNAAGLSWTATQGILSAKARDVYDDTGYAIKCLQVDTAINSGNSGGPLLNKFGQVVGINSAKIAASGYEGLGFSIPINEAKTVIDSLLKYGYVKGRVSLGIRGQTVDNGIYRGFMIVEILEKSCLEGTEAKVYDLIVSVDDVAVTDYGTLRAEMARHKVGDKVKLKLLRSNQRTGEVTTHYVTVTLKEQTAQ